MATPATSGGAQPSGYIFDNALALARERLTAAEVFLDPWTLAELERVGVRDGWSCLELGAGNGSIADWLCTRVGPRGRVVATDIDVRFLEHLRHPNLEVRRHDLTADPLETSQFDLVHGRLLLSHLPDRVNALRKMVAALKPGGWLLVEDFDHAVSHLVDPATDPEKARVFQAAMTKTFAWMTARGVDLDLGRQLYGLLCQQGLQPVVAEGHLLVSPGGSPFRQVFAVAVQQTRSAIVASGAFSEPEFEEFLAVIADPAVVSLSHILISACGQRLVEA